MDNLRKSSIRYSTAWSKDQLRAGFARFKELNGRYPMAHEIDLFPYLPSARSIQRSFGGLVNIRKELFPEEISDFTRGEHRSGVAKRTYAEGREYERQFFGFLIKQFAEVSVHEHKVIRPGNVNCDFYIYLNNEIGVVIDIFYAESIINMINVVNIKLKRYNLIIPETYLVVVGNPSITQKMVELKTKNRRIPLRSHIYVVTEEHFKQKIIPRLKKRSKYALL